MKIGRENGSTRRKFTPAPLCPPQIPLDGTRAGAVGSQQLTAWAVARPYCSTLPMNVWSRWIFRNSLHVLNREDFNFDQAHERKYLMFRGCNVFIKCTIVILPITVAARSQAWTAFARLDAGIVGSNPTRGMDVYVRLFCVCVALCLGRGFAASWLLVQGVLLSM
jgi:hypothetical protein